MLCRHLTCVCSIYNSVGEKHVRFSIVLVFDTFVISPHSRHIFKKYIFLFKLCKLRVLHSTRTHTRIQRLSKTKQTKTYLTLNHPKSDPVQRKRKRAKNKIYETIFGKLSAIVCRNCCHCCGCCRLCCICPFPP